MAVAGCRNARWAGALGIVRVGVRAGVSGGRQELLGSASLSACVRHECCGSVCLVPLSKAC